jgi:hypothetical protein
MIRRFMTSNLLAGLYSRYPQNCVSLSEFFLVDALGWILELQLHSGLKELCFADKIESIERAITLEER